MLRKLVGAAFILVLFVGITLAEEITAIITKVDGGKVTFAPFKDKEKQEAKTLPVAEKVKVVKGKFDKETKKMEAGDPIEDGLKNKMFTEIGEKGLFSTIITDKDNKEITEIRVFQFKKKDK
jgi:hypothetical protein